ncbi:MAG: amidase family protein [Myxococcota bacterium]
MACSIPTEPLPDARINSGAKELRDHRPTSPAEAVKRLEAAGAIVFAKTNLPLFAGEWQSFNELHGTTRNPWDPSRTPGGSSGGSAASVAAGYSALELGSDIGGSIRIPAHFCGVVGHKPTHGIIPMRGHVPGPPGSLGEPDLAVAGPMGVSVRDVELALRVLTGPRPEDAEAWSLSLPEAPPKELGAYRVGLWMDDAECPLEPDVRAVLEAAVAALEDAGLEVVRKTPFKLADHLETYVRLLAAVVGSGIPEKVLRRIKLQRPAMKLAWALKPPPGLLPAYLEGVLQTHREWLATSERRRRLEAELAAYFSDVDVLLMPNAPWSAPPHAQDGEIVLRKIQTPSGERDYVDHLPWIALSTVTGAPATSVPVGRTPEGLPVGLQVVSGRHRDLTCLAFAKELERVCGRLGAPPGYA